MLRESQGIREQFPGEPWIHFVKATLKFAYFLNYRNNVSLNFYNLRYVYFVWPLEYLIKKLIAPKKRATVSLISQIMQCTVPCATGMYW